MGTLLVSLPTSKEARLYLCFEDNGSRGHKISTAPCPNMVCSAFWRPCSREFSDNRGFQRWSTPWTCRPAKRRINGRCEGRIELKGCNTIGSAEPNEGRFDGR